MQGKLQALSIKTYVLLDKKGEVLIELEIKSEKHRKKIDSLQGTIVNIKDLESLLK